MRYYFTFGSNHLNGEGWGKYAEIIGVDDETARKIMFALYEDKWAFQYSELEFNSLEYRRALTRACLVEVT